jgi:hypothetical protein
LKPNRLTVAVLTAPVLATACLVLSVQAAEWGGRDWWSDTRPANAAEAAALGRAADLVRLLGRGDHPEQISPLRAGLIRESPAWLSAIEAAMWSDGAAMIRLLEREGAVLTDARRRQLACLASDLGETETASYLMAPGLLACEPGQALAAVKTRSGP